MISHFFGVSRGELICSKLTAPRYEEAVKRALITNHWPLITDH